MRLKNKRDTGQGSLTVHEVYRRTVLADVCLDLEAYTVESFFQTLLDDRSIERAREKDFLVLRGIGIISTT